MAGIRGTQRWMDLCRILKAELPAICSICGKGIDLNAPPRSSKSWSLDHITPLAEGGHPFALNNLTPTHYGCNSRKGKGSSPVRPKNSRPWG